MEEKKRIILGVTGSIAAYKSAEIIRRLCDGNFRVSVVMTESAEKFITPLTLSRLSQEQVYCSMFDQPVNPWDGSHVDLAGSADVFLIAPATANIIGKIATGIADDLLSCVAMATKAPIVIAPAMNCNMYSNKIVQDNISKLKDLGINFVEPEEGSLACGVEGVGRLASVEEIINKVASLI